jgi:hypothetical protein
MPRPLPSKSFQILYFWRLSIILFYLKKKHNVSETWFCLRLREKPTQLGPIDRASPYLRTPVLTPRYVIQAKHSTNHLRELRQNIKIYLKIHTYEALHQRTIKIDKNRTMNNVQKHNICINIPSSQTFRFYQSHNLALCIQYEMPITVATRSYASTVFVRSNSGIVGWNPTRCMDVCGRLFCVPAVLCIGSCLATGWSPTSRKSYRLCTGLSNWKSGQIPKGCRATERVVWYSEGVVKHRT